MQLPKHQELNGQKALGWSRWIKGKSDTLALQARLPLHHQLCAELSLLKLNIALVYDQWTIGWWFQRRYTFHPASEWWFQMFVFFCSGQLLAAMLWRGSASLAVGRPVFRGCSGKSSHWFWLAAQCIGLRFLDDLIKMINCHLGVFAILRQVHVYTLDW